MNIQNINQRKKSIYRASRNVACKNFYKVNLFLIFFLFILIGIGGVNAISCPSDWIFIDKASYNVCYLPNVNQTYSMNITDNSNNTLLSYVYDNGNLVYYSNFSTNFNLDGFDYLTYKGASASTNSTTYGIIYFGDNLIWISSERNLYDNSTGNERFRFKHYGVSKFYRGYDGLLVNNNQGGDTVLFSPNSAIKYVAGINFTINAWYTQILANKSYATGNINNFLNYSSLKAINSSVSYTESTNAINIRTSNITEIIYSGALVNNDPLAFYSLQSGVLINFNESYFIAGSAFSNSSSLGFYEGLRGINLKMVNGCSNTIRNYFISCSPWYSNMDLVRSIFLSKLFPNQYISDLLKLRMLHGFLLFFNNINNNILYAQDYNFFPPTNEGINDNKFNNTHTRLIGDYLMTLSELNYSDSVSLNLSNSFIDFLQTNQITNPINPLWKTISHSSNTQQYYDNAFILNTHTIGTSALITSKENGFSVNNSLLNEYINTMILSYPYLFNESYGNDSYYMIGCDGNYFACPIYENSTFDDNGTSGIYGHLQYVDLEINGYRIAYLYTHNETLRTIANRKINEMGNRWRYDLHGYKSIHGNQIVYYPPARYTYGQAKAEYHLNNISAFNELQNADNSYSNMVNYPWGVSLLPNNEIFTQIWYPVFLGKSNVTYVIDKENNFKISTPKYAFINDIQWRDNNIILWNKWAFNTSGSWTNLSYINYNYILDTQNKQIRNINQSIIYNADNLNLPYYFSDGNFSIYSSDLLINNYLYNNNSIPINLMFKETNHILVIVNNVIGYYSSGNINITLQPNNYFYILNNFNLTEGINIEYSPIWFSSSSTTSKHIASNLSNSVNVDVSFNVAQCDTLGTITYRSNNGTSTLTLRPGDYTCSNNVVTINNVLIEPATNSNEFTIAYTAQIIGICSKGGLTFLDAVKLIGVILTLILISGVFAVMLASFGGWINLDNIRKDIDLRTMLIGIMTILLTGLLLVTVAYLFNGAYCTAIGG